MALSNNIAYLRVMQCQGFKNRTLNPSDDAFLGFTLHDKYESGFDTLEDEVLSEDKFGVPFFEDDLTILRLIMDSGNQQVQGILSEIQTNQLSLYIGDTLYTWKQIASCFDFEEGD